MKLVVFGLGGVGRELCRQAISIGASISALADSSGILYSSHSQHSFTPQEVETVLSFKNGGKNLSKIASQINKNLAGIASNEEFVTQTLPNIITNSTTPVVVADCSAHDDPTSYLLPCQSLGVPVALANKKPLTGKLEHFKLLTQNRNLIRFESTVGAGLPINLSLRRLMDAGDVVLSAQGCLSGTLGYLLTAVENGEKFSSAVIKAKELGYTEPDPRDDLSGTDVARKALILARCLGSTLSLSDFPIQALYPKELGDPSMNTTEFLSKLAQSHSDREIEDKLVKARAKNCTLRYVATVTLSTRKDNAKTDGGVGTSAAVALTPGTNISVKVGLADVEKNSPLGQLSGTRNCVVFETERYSGRGSEFVVSGPGAGREVTAAGVLSDCIDLCRDKILPWGR